MININISLLIQIGNFVFLIFILNMLLYKPIRNILNQRKEKVTEFERSIETADMDAKEKDEAYNTGVKEARSKGLTEKNALLQTAADKEKEVIEKINKKAMADLTEVREKIKKDAETVRVSLQKDVDAFANAIGEKILGRAI
ncbi:ATPase [Thermodesulfobacteriota bacterium]